MKSFKDIYKLPLIFIDKDYYTRIYDSNSNFVFQFTFYNQFEIAEKLLNAINGKKWLTNDSITFYHQEGNIFYKVRDTKINVILIRGWGNLTGVGGHNLSSKEAINIQDTFAEFIVEQLNKLY